MLERARRKAGLGGVLVLGLDQQDARDAARDFLAEYRITYPNIRESGRDVARAYGATGLPETFSIGAGGRIVGHVVGAIDDDQLARASSRRAQADRCCSAPVEPARAAPRQT